jgi:hypothetical protein
MTTRMATHADMRMATHTDTRMATWIYAWPWALVRFAILAAN